MRTAWGTVIVACATVSLISCASIVEGTTQTIAVNVIPQTGTRVVMRGGEQLGVSTPEKRSVTKSKSKDNLSFACSAMGYQPKTEALGPDLSAATVARFFLLDFGIVDAATGAWKKYPAQVTVQLLPQPAPSPVPSQSQPASTTRTREVS